MKRILLITLLFLLIVPEISSQTKPFYQRADLWFRSNELDTSEKRWKNIGKDSIWAESGEFCSLSAKDINFHKGLALTDSLSMLRAEYPFSPISRVSVITVFHVSDTSAEQGVWSLSVDGRQLTGLSDRRLLREKTYYSYPLKRRGIPIIQVSVQSFAKKRSDSIRFVMGRCEMPDSSIASMKGSIAECIVFDKFLKKAEILRIESYLAIKYGISLYESDYVTPYDSIIWDYASNRDYSHSIAGIGRDSVFGLYQRQGSSVEEDLLSIGAGQIMPYNATNSAYVAEGRYLIWGHNNGALSCENLEDSIPLWDRQWLMQSTGTSALPTQVRIKMPVIKKKQTYYLVIDRSGSGAFDSLDCDYFVHDSIDGNAYVYFNNIEWDIDGSGKDIFGFSPGKSVSKVKMATLPDSLCENLGMPARQYLKPGESLYIEARQVCFDPVSYQWSNQNGLYSEASGIEVSEEGLYTLRLISSDGRMVEGQTYVSYLGEDYAIDALYDVYPNPSKGNFYVSVRLPEASEITMRIHSVSGSLLKECKTQGKSRYIFEEQLQTQGYYFIHIQSRFGEKTLKLVVTR